MTLRLSAQPTAPIEESIAPSTWVAYVAALLFVFAASMLAYRLVTTPAAPSLWYAGRMLLPLSTALFALSLVCTRGKVIMRWTANALFCDRGDLQYPGFRSLSPKLSRTKC